MFVHKIKPRAKWASASPGFNSRAFSIATAIFPGTLFVRSAELSFPENAQTPIAAEILFASEAADGPLHCSLDWRRTEGEEWTIDVRASDGTTVRLKDGGAQLSINGEPQKLNGPGEYPDIYREFVGLIDARRSLVDVRPLRLVADCLLASSRQIVDAVAT